MKMIKNWRHSTLLNTSYKIWAKVFQLRLQALLPEVIHEGQTAFLPSHYILDVVIVQNETISWAQKSDQELIMLKLDFRKA